MSSWLKLVWVAGVVARVAALGWLACLGGCFFTGEVTVVNLLPPQLNPDTAAALNPHLAGVVNLLLGGLAKVSWAMNVAPQTALLTGFTLVGWSLVVDYRRRTHPGWCSGVAARVSLTFAWTATTSVVYHMYRHLLGDAVYSDVILSFRVVKVAVTQALHEKQALYLQGYTRTLDGLVQSGRLTPAQRDRLTTDHADAVHQLLSNDFLVQRSPSRLAEAAAELAHLHAAVLQPLGSPPRVATRGWVGGVSDWVWAHAGEIAAVATATAAVYMGYHGWKYLFPGSPPPPPPECFYTPPGGDNPVILAEFAKKTTADIKDLSQQLAGFTKTIEALTRAFRASGITGSSLDNLQQGHTNLDERVTRVEAAQAAAQAAPAAAAAAAAGDTHRGARLPGLGHLTTSIANHKNAINAHAAALTTHDTKLAAQEKTITAHDTGLDLHDTTLAAHQTTLAAHQTKLTAHDTTLAAHDTRLTAHDNALDRHDFGLESHLKALAAHERKLDYCRDLINENREVIDSHHDVITAHREFNQRNATWQHSAVEKFEYIFRTLKELAARLP